MKQIIELIKNRISECEAKGDMFHLPSIDREDVKVAASEIESHGSLLCGDEYHITLANGDWIHIVSESKDKCRTFQTNPDRSMITVTCSDSSLNFTHAWDEAFFKIIR